MSDISNRYRKLAAAMTERIHAWDLARATGQDERLDPDEVHGLYGAMLPMDEAIRAPGAFGPKVEPPPGADEQTQLLCFLGRQV